VRADPLDDRALLALRQHVLVFAILSAYPDRLGRKSDCTASALLGL